MGEAVELKEAGSFAEKREELGDCEFYLEMMCQLDWPEKESLLELITHEKGDETPVYLNEDSLISWAGAILDIAKKAWVYEADVANEHKYTRQLARALWGTRGCLNNLYERYDYCQAQAMADNVQKLTKRYPTGYTNTDAQARADKQGEAQC